MIIRFPLRAPAAEEEAKNRDILVRCFAAHPRGRQTLLGVKLESIVSTFLRVKPRHAVSPCTKSVGSACGGGGGGGRERRRRAKSGLAIRKGKNEKAKTEIRLHTLDYENTLCSFGESAVTLF